MAVAAAQAAAAIWARQDEDQKLFHLLTAKFNAAPDADEAAKLCLLLEVQGSIQLQ